MSFVESDWEKKRRIAREGNNPMEDEKIEDKVSEEPETSDTEEEEVEE